ncbi:flagellar assembly protein FliH [Halanaerobium saccharolyticum]|uniref:Flagellar assembly protein FliH n=1 Tax=Halanaerobium saccharolyticum TaxID=43595 RepID=A0A4R7YPZ1_9FIRM|nr:FliH/SctL family protein [Halanaerobium saccharolyticum]RAK08895.1 flagellar assembly protein FliH [Halanaerobium saccharolyticum]TDV98935.1 flagellar assembly protein FliH [Halanaerobium saccharolyticum]TDX60658.1 flagellar assembly protein FliH [Halanaerobium saccharolyticum]
MSKVIKASKVTGEYKINQKPKTLSFKDNDSQGDSNLTNNKKVKKQQQVIGKAEQEAEEIIKNAEAEAKKIIENAKKEKEDILANKDQIYNEIKSDAKAEGLENAEAEIDRLKKELASLISGFEEEFSREKDRIRTDIIELAVKIASIVIDVKLETEHEMINNIISDMLSKIDDNHRDIVVRVNPQLLPYIEENRFYEHINQKNIEFVSDPELKKGDCIVETSLGGKEGSLEHKLDQIKTELLKEVEQHD